MSILITGSAGFIGSSLAEVLCRNTDIIGIDNFDNYYSREIKEYNLKSFITNPLFHFYEGDICNKNFLNEVFESHNIDSVIHLAGKAGVRASFEHKEEYIFVNEYGTKNILDTMTIFGVKKIIFASSSSVYGNSEIKMFSENMQNLIQISPYAVTKKHAEEIIQSYSENFGINALCLRLFTVYGKKQRPDLAIRKFTDLILENKPLTLYGTGESYRDYTYIDDVIDAFINGLKYDSTPYEIINIGSSNPVALKHLVKLLEKELCKKAELEFIPAQNGDVEGTFADINKAKKLLNYNPKFSDIEKGLHEFILSYTRN